MKVYFIVILVLIIVVFIVYKSFAKNNVEEQPYQVVKVYDSFEVRFYPSATIASINSNAKTYKDLGSSGFRKLANYIFGGNKDNKNIAMTAPVYMDINDSQSTMSFVMPNNYNSKNLPNPNDSSITIKETESVYVAVIKFSGFASDSKIKEYTDKLKKQLLEKQISFYGNFNYLGYNPPFQVINRRNEILVNINWSE
ncbi:MAG: heme-binding protein [Bacteroidota bacterium]|jgi:hypothetical protein